MFHEMCQQFFICFVCFVDIIGIVVCGVVTSVDPYFWGLLYLCQWKLSDWQPSMYPVFKKQSVRSVWLNRLVCWTRPQFYQTRSAWSMDQGSTKKRSAVHNFVPTVTKFCVVWEGLSLPQDTKFGNCREEIVDFHLILDPWIKLIWFDKSGARRLLKPQLLFGTRTFAMATFWLSLSLQTCIYMFLGLNELIFLNHKLFLRLSFIVSLGQVPLIKHGFIMAEIISSIPLINMIQVGNVGVCWIAPI